MRSNHLFVLTCMAVMMTVSACAESTPQPALEETSCQTDTECQKVNPAGTCNVSTGFCILGTCGNGRIDEGEECDGLTLNGAKCPSGKVGKVACNMFCYVDFSACQDQETCLDNARTCNGNQPQVCRSGKWENDGKLCDYGCDSKTGQCNTETVSCTADSKQCNGSVVQTCNGSTWVDGETCPYGCERGVCKTAHGVCDEGVSICNGAVVQTCENDSWVEGERCQYGCTEGTCNGQFSVCEEGVKQCNGSVVQTCENNTWVNSDTCQYGCTEGSCYQSSTECEQGKLQCNGSFIQTCSSAGKWVNGTDCTFGCTNGVCNTELRNCEEGEVICNGSYIQTCKNNEMVVSTQPCAYGCQNGKCIEASKTCVSGATQCSGAVVQTCNSDGTAWVNGVTCTTGCQNGKCNNQCTSGQVNCNGNQPLSCSVRNTGNIWINNGSSCQYGCDSSSGDCTSAKACTGVSSVENGSGGCISSSTYGICNNGSWSNQKTCNGGCVSNTCYAECKPGTQVCSGTGSVRKCRSNGSAWDTSPCPSSAPVCDSGTNTCRALKTCSIGGSTVASGSKACDGLKVYSCQDGSSSFEKTCSNSQNCVDGACVSKGQCTSYYSNTIDSGKVGCVTATAFDFCNNGSWESASPADCTTNVPNATGICVSSLENAETEPCSFKCDNGYTLSNGSCVGNPCTDKDGHTINHGDDGCVSSTVYGICGAGSWSLTETCITQVDHATGVCKNGSCSFECNTGFTQSGNTCVSTQTGATYTASTDFEWITNSSSNYTTKATGNPGVSYGSIEVVARLDSDKSMITMNGAKWPLLRTNEKPASQITVSDLTHGLGRIVFNYNGHDSGVVTITAVGGSSAKKTVTVADIHTVLSSGEIVFNDASATGFVITTNGRIGIDDLSWTSQN